MCGGCEEVLCLSHMCKVCECVRCGGCEVMEGGMVVLDWMIEDCVWVCGRVGVCCEMGTLEAGWHHNIRH